VFLEGLSSFLFPLRYSKHPANLAGLAAYPFYSPLSVVVYYFLLSFFHDGDRVPSFFSPAVLPNSSFEAVSDSQLSSLFFSQYLFPPRLSSSGIRGLM